MQNKYKVSTRNGQPAIFTDRGLVCLMEAGCQSTREKDAAEMVAILNAAPDLLAQLQSIRVELEAQALGYTSMEIWPHVRAEMIRRILLTISKSEGGK